MLASVTRFGNGRYLMRISHESLSVCHSCLEGLLYLVTERKFSLQVTCCQPRRNCTRLTDAGLGHPSLISSATTHLALAFWFFGASWWVSSIPIKLSQFGFCVTILPLTFQGTTPSRSSLWCCCPSPLLQTTGPIESDNPPSDRLELPIVDLYYSKLLYVNN
ncbi:uncharacterized protein B0J16DRAFT_177311 [Fusarium flagelliforme]|uniref:uncharacterized protein n=1 Tax=Fusarium flagelliforme TaxID=2675880 RepID=UPI001E8E244E|nr:uncharacterized protein B0J16DRAFT_177311 [Fusarium flagelliforme]KAH7179783.1 hypothetical protein B0J16DRAFT_177311 [Fusarium flagelliforme]